MIIHSNDYVEFKLQSNLSLIRLNWRATTTLSASEFKAILYILIGFIREYQISKVIIDIKVFHYPCTDIDLMSWRMNCILPKYD